MLTCDVPLTLHVVLSDAALRNSLGGAEIFREQLAHLRDYAARSNITVQVLSFTSAAHPGMAGAFTVLRLLALDAVHIKLMNSDVYAADDRTVSGYLRAFDTLAARALNATESNAYIEEAEALAAHRAAEQAGTLTLVPQAEVRRRLGLEPPHSDA